ncbi:MAG: hypothetical protein U1F23_02420 [Lysobacterales bacterium]
MLTKRSIRAAIDTVLALRESPACASTPTGTPCAWQVRRNW